MKKVRQYIRPGRPGYWVSWRVDGRVKCKQLNTKTEQTHFANLIYQRINNDVYDAIDLPIAEAVFEYLQYFDIRGLAESSKQTAKRTLDRFVQTAAPRSSRSINQAMVDYFILARKNTGGSVFSLNTEIGRMRAWLTWLKKRSYHPGGIEINLIKTPDLDRKQITTDDIRRLITAADAADKSGAWRVRILLSLFTGWRKYDVDNLAADAVDLENKTITVIQHKTGKRAVKAIPDAAVLLVRQYAESRPEKDVRFFGDSGVRGSWDNIRKIAGLYKIDEKTKVTQSGQRKKANKIIWKVSRQDLRRTYATIIETTRPIFDASAALQHSSRDVTGKHYLDRMAVDRMQANQLPIAAWLEPIELKKHSESNNYI